MRASMGDAVIQSRRRAPEASWNSMSTVHGIGIR